MTTADTVVRAVIYCVIAIASMGLGTFLIWLERRTAAPVIRERINSGSDKFFIEEQEREAEAALESD